MALTLEWRLDAATPELMPLMELTVRYEYELSMPCAGAHPPSHSSILVNFILSVVGVNSQLIKRVSLVDGTLMLSLRRLLQMMRMCSLVFLSVVV